MTTQWKAVERAAADQMVAAVRVVREQHPGEKIYGAMFHEFYGDGSVMYWPMVTVGTEESLRAVIQKYPEDDLDEFLGSLRWSGADLPHGFDPSDDVQAIADAVHTAASPSGLFEERVHAYNRFLRCFPHAAKAARKTLIAAGDVEKDFVAIAADESGELIPLSLTKSQLRRHFPEYEVAER